MDTDNLCKRCGAKLNWEKTRTSSRFCDKCKDYKIALREKKSLLKRKLKLECYSRFNIDLSTINTPEECDELNEMLKKSRYDLVYITCEQCGKKYKGRHTQSNYGFLCDECKKGNTHIWEKKYNLKRRLKDSKYGGMNVGDIDSMTLDEINNVKENMSSVLSDITSERMKKSNPMFNKKTRDKVSKTIRNKVESGELKYPSGKNHYLYKGTTDFNNTCRARLCGAWVRPILERDSFTCRICGNKHKLQVHHVRPLRDIISKVFNDNNLEPFSSTSLYEKDTEMFEKLVEAVVNEHNLDDGITVCKDCHAKIDYQYRPYKGRKKCRK